MTQNSEEDYPSAITAQMGQLLQSARKSAGVSAQRLADLCTTAGTPITRNVIASIESGRRASIGVDELLTIAHVLNIPPVTLLFPITTAPFDDCVTRPSMNEGAAYGLDWIIGSGNISYWDDFDESNGSKLNSAATHAHAVLADLRMLREALAEVIGLAHMFTTGGVAEILAKEIPVDWVGEKARLGTTLDLQQWLTAFIRAWEKLTESGVNLPPMHELVDLSHVVAASDRIIVETNDENLRKAVEMVRELALTTLKVDR